MNSTRINSPNFGARVLLRDFTQATSCKPKLTKLTQKAAKGVRLPKGFHFEVFQSVVDRKLPLHREKTLSLAICNEAREVQGDGFNYIYHQRVTSDRRTNVDNYGNLGNYTRSGNVRVEDLPQILKRAMRAMATGFNNGPLSDRVQPLCDRIKYNVKPGNKKAVRVALTELANMLGFEVRIAAPKGKKPSARISASKASK